jgi:transposase
MNKNNKVNLQEAMKMLGVGDSYIFKLVRQGAIKRVSPGQYDKKSIIAHMERTKLSSKYESRKWKILELINEAWKVNFRSTTINEIAKRMKISTSMAARHVDKMHENGMIEIDRHLIYPIGLRDKLKAGISEFYK